MKKTFLLQCLFGVVLLVGAGLAVVLLWTFRPQPATVERVVPIPTVEVMVVEPGPVTLQVRSQGNVVAQRSSRLAGEMAGVVDWIDPRLVEGGFFRENEIMVRQESSTYETAVVRAESEVAGMSLRVAEEEARAAQARREWVEMGNGGEASQLVLRQLHLEREMAALESARAMLAEAEADLKRTRIRAPYDLLVRERLVNVGEYLSPGSPVAEVFGVDQVEVRFPVTPLDAALLPSPVFTVEGVAELVIPVRLEGESGGRLENWEGRLVRYAGTVDARSRQQFLVAEIDDPYRLHVEDQGSAPLPIGTFVQVYLEGREVPGAVVLPRAAMEGNDAVYVVDDQDRLRRREVEVARLGREEVVVTAGLNRGDKVCITPLEIMADGLRVRVADVVVHESDPDS